MGNVALRQERAGVTRNHFRCPNLGTEMTEVSVVKTAVWQSTATGFFALRGVAVAEDDTHHLPNLLLSIPVFPVKLYHTLLNRLLALSLRTTGRSYFHQDTYSVTRAEATL